MLKLAIAEDDDNCAEQLLRFAKDFAAEEGIEIDVRRYTDGMDLLDRYDAPDILLMDIEMPHMDGMTAAARIRRTDERVLILFITNMARYAIKGYEVGAMDYVLKPIGYYAFCMKMRKALRILRERRSGQIMLQDGAELRFIPTDSILSVEVYGHKLCYHTAEGDLTLIGSRTLKDAEAQLSEYSFLRCSQSCLVNPRHVRCIGKEDVTVGSLTMKISRGHRKAFMEGMTRYLGGGTDR